ncbi:MAG: hypothetical protein ACK41O_26280 [Runella zeae]
MLNGHAHTTPTPATSTSSSSTAAAATEAPPAGAAVNRAADIVKSGLFRPKGQEQQPQQEMVCVCVCVCVCVASCTQVKRLTIPSSHRKQRFTLSSQAPPQRLPTPTLRLMIKRGTSGCWFVLFSLRRLISQFAIVKFCTQTLGKC